MLQLLFVHLIDKDLSHFLLKFGAAPKILEHVVDSSVVLAGGLTPLLQRLLQASLPCQPL